MDTLLEILSAKPRGVIATSTAATVRQATRLMNDHGIGSLLVTSGNRLVGIFTERDVLRRVVAEGRSPDCDVVCCPPEAGVEDAADIMRRRRVRHVPVVDHDDSVVGLVSIGDINAQRFAACATELVQVRDYIMGRA